MFVAKKTQKPNILRKKPPVKSPDIRMATTPDLLVQNKMPPNKKNHQINHAFESGKKDSIAHFNVIIDAKHNISLVPNKSQDAQNVCQAAKESSMNLHLVNQNGVLDNVSGAQKVQINMCNVNITGSQESLQTCNGSQFENLNSKTVISEEDILGNSIKPLKYKCETCNKRFISEKKYLKHANSHNKDSTKNNKPSSFECPARKTIEDGVTEPCGQIFLVRDDLLKHLNEDHTAEDARYKCGKCSRRFFWSLALTGHARGDCGRGVLRCSWPACPRTFLQPCRLREHMRMHTGEKPYRCHYPGCAGVFRTASKLRRHVPRHTRERRHACACGRAYSRADHLAGHRAAAHCQTKLKSDSPVSETDVDDPFPISDQIVLPDLQQQSAQDLISRALLDTIPTISNHTEPVITAKNEFDVMPDQFHDSQVTVEDVGGAGETHQETETEWQSARTHCTWPLTRSHTQTETVQPDQIYVLEGGVQVDMPEENSNNIYTIRSDLFLHGNVLNNEDSEMITTGPEVQISQPLDAELSLLDSHPNTDLMQEELMYTNVTIDDSLFRVFYLSEEFAAPSPS